MSSSNPADNNQNMGPFPRQKRKVLVRRWVRDPQRSVWIGILACGHMAIALTTRHPRTKSEVCPRCSKEPR